MASANYYTYLVDVEAECQHYNFQDKWVYLPSDNRESAFWKYFSTNFDALGLRRLTGTCLNDDASETGTCFDLCHDLPLEITPMESGSMMSKQSQKLARSCDIVVTTPPSELASQYLIWLLDKGIKFLMLVPTFVYTNKKVIQYLSKDSLWDGISAPISGYMRFQVTSDFDHNKVIGLDSDGKPYIKAKARWITNLPLVTTGRRFIRPYTFTAHYDSHKYNLLDELTSDDLPILNIDKLADIPLDYAGIMAVPVSYAVYHDPDQFKILTDQTNKLSCNKQEVQKILIRKINPFAPGMKIGRLELVELQYWDDEIFWICFCDCNPENPNVTAVSWTQLQKGYNCHCGCLTGSSTPALQDTEAYEDLYNWWRNQRKYGSLCREWQDDFESCRKWFGDHGYLYKMEISKHNSRKPYSPENTKLTDTTQSIVAWTSSPPEQWWIKTGFNYSSQSGTLRILNNIFEWSEILGIPAGELAHRLLCKSGNITKVCSEDPNLQDRLNDYIVTYQASKE